MSETRVLAERLQAAELRLAAVKTELLRADLPPESRCRAALAALERPAPPTASAGVDARIAAAFAEHRLEERSAP